MADEKHSSINAALAALGLPKDNDGDFTVAPGVTCHQCSWGFFLIGKKDALLRAGVALPEWFLDGKKRDGRGALREVRCRLDTLGRGEVVCRQPANDNCSVAFHWTPEEEQRFDALTERARNEESRRRSIEDRIRRGRETLAREGGFRGNARRFFGIGLSGVRVAFNVGDDPDNPWGFPAETIERVKECLLELEELFDEGGFKDRPAPLLQVDSEFQRFMQRATSTAQ